MKSYAVTIDKWKQFEFNFFATILKIPKNILANEMRPSVKNVTI